MGPDKTRQAAILDEVRSISYEQRGLFAENRLEDLLRRQRRREELLAELSGLGPVDYGNEPYSSVIRDIIENDRLLALGVESSKNEVGARLGRIRSGVRAMKAYSG